MKNPRRWMKWVVETTNEDTGPLHDVMLPWQRGGVREGFAADRKPAIPAQLASFPASARPRSGRTDGFGLTA